MKRALIIGLISAGLLSAITLTQIAAGTTIIVNVLEARENIAKIKRASAAVKKVAVKPFKKKAKVTK